MEDRKGIIRTKGGGEMVTQSQEVNKSFHAEIALQYMRSYHVLNGDFWSLYLCGSGALSPNDWKG